MKLYNTLSKQKEELKDEDITVVNHSLLARWPYTDEKPMENIIVDEAHNLVEKGYDFFSEEIDAHILAVYIQIYRFISLHEHVLHIPGG